LRSELVLGLDTSGPWVALALVRGETLLAQTSEPMERGQAEVLMPLVQNLMAGAGAQLRDLHRIGVGTGPGNFTGVRMGVSLARGLALGLGIPAIGVTRFAARALGLTGTFAVVEDARHGACYVLDHSAPGAPPRLTEISALPMEIGDIAVVGSAAAEAAAATGGAILPATFDLAEAIARIAAKAPLPQPRPAPLYLRPADAAPARAALAILP